MLIWLMFVLGELLHLAVQVDTIARARNNPVNSRRRILSDRWSTFAARLFLCSMIFWLFLGGGLPEILQAFGSDCPDWLAALYAVMQGTPGAALAGIIGWGIDSALAYIPLLKSSLPPAPDLPAQAGCTAGSASAAGSDSANKPEAT